MKSKILAFLPKAASLVTYQVSSPLLSPAAGRKGFGSPMVSRIPEEAQRQPRNLSFQQQEPASPNVSCMGQVKNMKNKKNNKKKKNMIRPKEVLHPAPARDTTPVLSAKDVKKNERVSTRKIFKGGKQCDDVIVDHRPPLRRVTKYGSSRDGGGLAKLNWRI